MNEDRSGDGVVRKRSPRVGKYRKYEKGTVGHKSAKYTHSRSQVKQQGSSSLVSLNADNDTTDSDNESRASYRKGGYHPVKIGEEFKNGQYIVLQKLGWGHFSTVWLVQDTRTACHRAMKVQKSALKYTEAAYDEIRLLMQIRDGDPKCDRCCCHLLDWFEHCGTNGKHVCMVFEMLGDNLLKLIKHFNYQGIPLQVVRNIAKQVLIGLDYLHRECHIIHTDLKPENVMLAEPLSLRRVVRSTDVSRTYCWPQQKLSADRMDLLNKNQKKRMKTAEKAGVRPSIPNQSAQIEQIRAGSSLGDGGHSMSDNFATGDEGKDSYARQGGTSGRGEMEVVSPGLKDQELEFVTCKVVDFGNACWTNKHFTDDIQTRQYRSPEVLLGADYSTPADMWSLACVVFELATGDFLFDPRSGRDYSRDEDQLALFIELLGQPPRRITSTGQHVQRFFSLNGELKHIKRLRYWPLGSVLIEKYRMARDESVGLTEFLLPMLQFDPEQRATAQEMLSHPWLRGELPYGGFVPCPRPPRHCSQEKHEKMVPHSRSKSWYSSNTGHSTSHSSLKSHRMARLAIGTARRSTDEGDPWDESADCSGRHSIKDDARTLMGSTSQIRGSDPMDAGRKEFDDLQGLNREDVRDSLCGGFSEDVLVRE